jgi:hypothetical protein
MGNLGKGYTGQRTLLVLFIIYSHQYQPPSTFIIALSSPRYFSRAQKSITTQRIKRQYPSLQ